MDFKKIVGDVKTVLDQQPDEADLRRIRATLDDPVFMDAWKDYIKTTNDYNERDECKLDLAAIQSHCNDRSGDRNNELTNVRYGIGIGGSMAASSIIGLATAATAAFFVLPLVCGVAVAGVCMAQTGWLGREERLYKDIESRVTKILEAANG